jgi:hypothetical protein
LNYPRTFQKAKILYPHFAVESPTKDMDKKKLFVEIYKPQKV